MAVKIDASAAGIPNVAANAGTLANVLNVAYFLAGAIAVLVIVIAGFSFVTSNGNPERAKAARTAIVGAVVGLVVVLMAAAITSFLIARAK